LFENQLPLFYRAANILAVLIVAASIYRVYVSSAL
jgi:hypothetical protein